MCYLVETLELSLSSKARTFVFSEYISRRKLCYNGLKIRESKMTREKLSNIREPEWRYNFALNKMKVLAHASAKTFLLKDRKWAVDGCFKYIKFVISRISIFS